MNTEKLLERSELLHEALIACFPAVGFVPAIFNAKHELILAACALCIEHGHVVRSAFEMDAPSSATALLRMQYEAVVRAAWVMFAATPEQVSKLASELDADGEREAKNLPASTKMLEALLKVAPQGLTAPLSEFNQYSRHALNSFVHTGIHALHRMRHGYPLDLALTLIKFSNALSYLSFRLLAGASGSQRRMDRVTNLHQDFGDCLPMAKAVE